MVRQAAEMREGATPDTRAHKTDLIRAKAHLARLEMDMTSAGNVYTRRVWENEVARQRKQLEEMNMVLDGGTLTL